MLGVLGALRNNMFATFLSDVKDKKWFSASFFKQIISVKSHNFHIRSFKNIDKMGIEWGQNWVIN